MPVRNPSELQVVKMPTDLRKRARAVAVHFKTNESQILRDAYRERIEALEKKVEEDKEREALRQLSSKGRLAMRTLEDIPTPSMNRPRTTAERTVRLGATYEQHAKLIAEASQAEMRAIVAQAIKAIRNEAPLTSGSDEDIITRIEPLVKQFRDEKRQAKSQEIASQLSAILHGDVDRAEDGLDGKEVDFDDEDDGP